MNDCNTKAAQHESAGGDRNAYVDGWQTMDTGEALFRNMKRYEGQKQTSFIQGYQDCDTALSAPSNGILPQ